MVDFDPVIIMLCQTQKALPIIGWSQSSNPSVSFERASGQEQNLLCASHAAAPPLPLFGPLPGWWVGQWLPCWPTSLHMWQHESQPCWQQCPEQY